MSDDPFADLRAGLLQSYRHRAVEGFPCSLCGRFERPLALHLVEWSQPGEFPVLWRDLIIPMSQSDTTGELCTRGSFGFCDECAPPCRKCGLPVRTKAIEDFRRERQGLVPDPSTYLLLSGVGDCRHAHPLLRRRRPRPRRRPDDQSLVSESSGSQLTGHDSPSTSPEADALRERAAHISKQVVAAGLAERCDVNLSYSDDGSPVLMSVDAHGTETVPVARIEQLAREWLLGRRGH